MKDLASNFPEVIVYLISLSFGKRKKKEDVEKLLICQVENSAFHFQGKWNSDRAASFFFFFFLFYLGKQHIIPSVKYWNHHKIVF